MKLRKEICNFETLEFLSHNIEYGITASAKDFGDVILLRITDIREDGKLNGDFKFYTGKEQLLSKYQLNPDDVLIARSGATAGKPYIHKSKGDFIFGSYLLRVKLIKEKINPDYFYTFLNSFNYWGQLNGMKIGTAQPNVNTTNLKTLRIPLPPLEEQKQIAALFQAFDRAIEDIQAQEQNVRTLRTKLASDLVRVAARFGHLLNSANCQPVTLGQIAKEIRENSKSPLEEGIERYVGLEHLDPGNLKIARWGNVAEGTTFTKTFKRGDVLFGRRRAYLKKAARADFEGLCSGDITVLRANSTLILPDLLPYYLSADAVFEFAVSNSAGSLSPRAKWRDLSKFECSLPDLKVQEKILAVFQSLDAVITQCQDQQATLKTLKQTLLDDIFG